jgi:hypothetical protein
MLMFSIRGLDKESVYVQRQNNSGTQGVNPTHMGKVGSVTLYVVCD